ncbi:MAG: haloacid dehalogenase-like hydrolase, partial [Bdellovibrionales bacterium]|nr:haloacid dehalogenase-like hydrolase [Bdellovibrionales bacterium]
MEKNEFSPQLFEKITNELLTYMENNPGPYYAAFDADGTLWDSDLGEQFFQYEIDEAGLDKLKNVDPWEYYETTKEVDPIKAYLWLAQINEGQPIDKVRQWDKEAVDKKGARVFESQKKMISWLQNNGIETFIVTASIQWAVEPAGHLAGIDSDHVLGIKTKIDDQGRV